MKVYLCVELGTAYESGETTQHIAKTLKKAVAWAKAWQENDADCRSSKITIEEWEVGEGWTKVFDSDGDLKRERKAGA